MPARSARRASFCPRIFGRRQIVPLASTRQVSVIFSETAFQFHLNIKMIQNAWSTKASHGDSRGLIQYSSFCHYRHSKLGQPWQQCEFCFRWLPKLSRQSDAGSSACRLKTSQTSQSHSKPPMDPMGCVLNHPTLLHGVMALHLLVTPIKDLYALRPGEKATKSWRFYTCSDHSWEESTW